jgi:hypothetical protein
MTLRNKTSPDRCSRALECAAHGWRVFPVHGVNNGVCGCPRIMFARGEASAAGLRQAYIDSRIHTFTRSLRPKCSALKRKGVTCSNADLSKWAILTRNSANEPTFIDFQIHFSLTTRASWKSRNVTHLNTNFVLTCELCESYKPNTECSSVA